MSFGTAASLHAVLFALGLEDLVGDAHLAHQRAASANGAYTEYIRIRLGNLQRLWLEILLESVLPQLATVPRLFHTAERRVRIERRAVDVELRGANAPRDAQGACDVARPHGSAESVDRVVRDANRMLFVVVRKDGAHRSEDLLLGDLHVAAHVGKKCRPYVVTRLEADGRLCPTGQETRAFVDPRLDVRAHALALARGDERAEARLSFARIADRVRAAQLVEREADRLLLACARHQHARPRSARLTGVDERVIQTRAHRLLEVRVVEDHARRLSAQLERDLLDRLRRELRAAAASGGGAGGRDPVDTGMSR